MDKLTERQKRIIGKKTARVEEGQYERSLKNMPQNQRDILLKLGKDDIQSFKDSFKKKRDVYLSRLKHFQEHLALQKKVFKKYEAKNKKDGAW